MGGARHRRSSFGFGKYRYSVSKSLRRAVHTITCQFLPFPSPLAAAIFVSDPAPSPLCHLQYFSIHLICIPSLTLNLSLAQSVPDSAHLISTSSYDTRSRIPLKISCRPTHLAVQARISGINISQIMHEVPDLASASLKGVKGPLKPPHWVADSLC